MSREDLRPWCRWMPKWLLQATFILSIAFVLLPCAVWDAIRSVFREIRQDWRDLNDEYLAEKSGNGGGESNG